MLSIGDKVLFKGELHTIASAPILFKDGSTAYYIKARKGRFAGMVAEQQLTKYEEDKHHGKR